MRQDLPCGSAFVYRKENHYKMEMTVNLSGKASREAIDWINYVQFDARFKSPTGVYRIQTALDGEKTIAIKGKKFTVDGYVKTPNGVYIMEYFGVGFNILDHIKISKFNNVK